MRRRKFGVAGEPYIPVSEPVTPATEPEKTSPSKGGPFRCAEESHGLYLIQPPSSSHKHGNLTWQTGVASRLEVSSPVARYLSVSTPGQSPEEDEVEHPGRGKAGPFHRSGYLRAGDDWVRQCRPREDLGGVHRARYVRLGWSPGADH
jgi:hypothetical protein